ncbi:hypothetical protein DVA67_003160 [Solirubrobacter sp. CPCC 204708]|uniref:Tox-REase-2 domain-containing protein n=1 Tax=Solirubrobacter deserti TaxID=2282478 RepID=A0ABT4RNR5_9ACTN|nr:restriction endonuclease fold toxin-2 domain-containing protein [Solirubrobacter deserti]MBE2314957.1 hypothetical protein [Solirubrobacter deserti]MDA0140189.1 hypothetical protein [Solirubrobacter deserti]
MPGGACPYCSALSRALDANDYLMGDGASAIWADGFRATDASILCAKAVGPDPSRSPWVKGSDVPERLRVLARRSFEHEIARYQAVWADPSTPVRGLEVVTDDARAVPVLEAILAGWAVPSRVVVHG